MTQGTCSVPSCHEPHMSRGYCNTHYARFRRTGSPQEELPVTRRRATRPDTCTVDGCATKLTPKDARDLCAMHYRRLRLNGDVHTVHVVRHTGSVQERFWAKVNKTETC